LCLWDRANKLECRRIAVGCESVISDAGIQVKTHPIQQLSSGEFLYSWVMLGKTPRDDVIDQCVSVAVNLTRKDGVDVPILCLHPGSLEAVSHEGGPAENVQGNTLVL
jgi:hypothetical protein